MLVLCWCWCWVGVDRVSRFCRVRPGGDPVGRFCRRSPSPRPRWPYSDPGRFQIGTGGLPTHPGLLLDAPQGPSQSSQGYHLLFFRFAQDVAHTDEGYCALRQNQRPRALLSLAGFEVTLIGRFWVTPED